MKNIFVIILSIILLFGCKSENPIESNEPFGTQYYRMTQFDFDGQSDVYYSDNVATNNNPRPAPSNGRVKQDEMPLALTCEIDGIVLFIGIFNTWFTIDDDTHDGTIIIDGISYDPILCVSETCTWAVPNDDITVMEFTTNGESYTWEGTPFDCTALPIELLSFTVEPNDDGTNTITIVTASETNADYMLIERSSNLLDEDSWKFVAKVIFKNSPIGATYVITDK